MNQSDRVQSSVYFPKDIHEDLVKSAEAEDHPLSNLVVGIVAQAIQEKTARDSSKEEDSR